MRNDPLAPEFAEFRDQFKSTVLLDDQARESIEAKAVASLRNARIAHGTDVPQRSSAVSKRKKLRPGVSWALAGCAVVLALVALIMPANLLTRTTDQIADASWEPMPKERLEVYDLFIVDDHRSERSDSFQDRFAAEYGYGFSVKLVLPDDSCLTHPISFDADIPFELHESVSGQGEDASLSQPANGKSIIPTAMEGNVFEMIVPITPEDAAAHGDYLQNDARYQWYRDQSSRFVESLIGSTVTVECMGSNRRFVIEKAYTNPAYLPSTSIGSRSEPLMLKLREED